MKKEKLTLSTLKIKSFVTSLNNKESQYIKGGTVPGTGGGGGGGSALPTLAGCATDQSCQSVQVCSEHLCSENCLPTHTNTNSNDTEQCITDDGN